MDKTLKLTTYRQSKLTTARRSFWPLFLPQFKSNV